MTPRPFKILTCLSLLLCPAALAGWAWSYTGSITSHLSFGSHYVGFTTHRGRLAVGHARAPRLDPPAPEPRWFWPPMVGPPGPSAGPWESIGFARGTVSLGRTLPVLGDLPVLGRVFTSSVDGSYVQVPWWLLAVFTAAAPCAYVRRIWRRRRRAVKGLCPACAYDLRASPGRCPECGEAAPQEAVESAQAAR